MVVWVRFSLRPDRLPLSLPRPQGLLREMLERGSCVAEAKECADVAAGEGPPPADRRRLEGLLRSGSVETRDVDADAEAVAWATSRWTWGCAVTPTADESCVLKFLCNLVDEVLSPQR